MSIDKAIIDQVNDLKILRSSLSDFSLKKAEEITKQITDHISSENAEEACELFEEALSGNPDLKILHFFIAVTKLHFQPGDHFPAEQELEKFFQGLESGQKKALAMQISEWLVEKYDSVFLWEYIAQSLLATLSQPHSTIEKETLRQKLITILLKLHHAKVHDNDNTETLADLLSNSTQPEELSQALFYYQVIIGQLIKSNSPRKILRVWKKILQSKNLQKNLEQQSEFEKLLNTLNHIASITDDKIKAEIFSEISQLKKAGEMENLFRIFKMALTCDVFIPLQLEQLSEKWAQLYREQPCYSLFLKLSGLEKSLVTKSENINCQKLLKEIEEFKKLIALGAGTLVEHRSFGIGVIREINLTSKKPDESNVFLIIDFESKKQHSMSLRIAISSLEIAHPSHLRGLKLFFPDRLDEILKTSTTTLFRHILLTLKKPLNSKQIKSFMVPEIMTDETWKQRWKEIKNTLPEMADIKVKNNFYIYDNTPSEVENSNTGFLEKYNQLSTIKDQITYLEESLHHKIEDRETVITTIKKMLDDFKQSDPSQHKEIHDYFPALLALAQRVKCTISSEIWNKGKSLSIEQESENKSRMTLSFSLLQHTATRNEFIKNLGALYPSETLPEIGLLLLNGVNGSSKEYVLDYWGYHFGNESMQRIFELVDKEYLTSLDTFILLAKTDIDKDSALYPGNRTLLFQKLIRALHQCHLNIEINKDRSNAKKNFNILYRLLFDDGHLFRHLKNNPEITQEERIAILENLEQKTYLDNNVKREVRTLHTSLGQL